MTADEIANLRAAGLAVTTFADAINEDDVDALATARETVQLHHPDEVIWIER